jgi:hypothetical protein
MSKKKSLKVSIKEPPSMFLQQVPCIERCSVSRANGLLIHFYLSEFPFKGPMGHEIWGKHAVTVYRAPHGQKAYT